VRLHRNRPAPSRLYATRENACENSAALHHTANADTSLARYQLLSQRSRDIFLFVRRGDLRILEVNDAALAAYGYEQNELLGMSLVDLYAAGSEYDHNAALDSIDIVGGTFFEAVHRRKDGTTFTVEASAQSATLGGERIVLAVVRDISAQRAAESRLAYLAQHDSLTGLANRALTVDHLNQAIASAKSTGTICAVLFIGMDRFNTVNNALGHSAGDEFLKAVAERLRQNARQADAVGRLDGDEFIVVLTDLCRTDDATAVARKISASLSSPALMDDCDVEVTASIGTSAFPVDGSDAETLIRNAGAAMYHVKNSGGDSVEVFTSEMLAQEESRLGLESALRQALRQQEFHLEYQPVINMASGVIVGAEALLRWRHTLAGMHPPDDFVPLAEELGLIGPIGDWVLDAACAQSLAWRKAGRPAIRMTVNVSTCQVLEARFVDDLVATMRRYEMDPSNLELELTETAIMKDVDRAASVLFRLRALGVRISIDDFGTGYSSLGYLKRLPIDTLKIDRSFIRELDVDPASQAITAAVITVAHNLKLRVIAEGVETAAQYRVLRRLSCDEMQGYFFSRPVLPAEFQRLFNDKFAEIVSQAR